MKHFKFILILCCVFCVSCGPEEGNLKPIVDTVPEELLGQWLYVDDTNDNYYFAQALGIHKHTNNIAWQISEQEYNELRSCVGLLAYDASTKTLKLSCTSSPGGTHVKMNGSEITSIKIVTVGTDKLTVEIGGIIRTYSKNTSGIFLPYHTWTEKDNENDKEDEEPNPSYSDKIVGKWIVTMDDPSWRCEVEFKSNGTYISKDYYDIEGDESFSELDGTYTGTYSINGTSITIDGGDYGSVIDGEYTIVSLGSNSGRFQDDDGWCLYLEKK